MTKDYASKLEANKQKNVSHTVGKNRLNQKDLTTVEKASDFAKSRNT